MLSLEIYSRLWFIRLANAQIHMLIINISVSRLKVQRKVSLSLVISNLWQLCV